MATEHETSSTGHTHQETREHTEATRLSESEFLAQQAQAAKEAFSKTAQELVSKLGQGADPRTLTKEHPWVSLAVAAAGGFAAAAIAVPSKEQQALKRLAEMERALGIRHRSNGHPADMHDDEDAGAKSYSAGKSSFWTGLGRQVLEAVKPALLSALTAGITAKASQPDVEGASMGQGQPMPAQDAPTSPSI